MSDNKKLIKGQFDEIETYRGFKIVFEHDLNIFERTDNLYTVCGMGRVFQGPIENVRKCIDYMFKKYGSNN